MEHYMELELAEIAARIGGVVKGNPEKRIRRVLPFEAAGADAITFAEGKKEIAKLSESAAGAVLVPLYVENGPVNLVRVENPRAAFAKAIAMLHPTPRPSAGIHPGAIVESDAILGDNVTVGPCAVIGKRVVLKDRVVIHAGSVIGDDVRIDCDSTIHSNVTVYRGCKIGKRVIVHSGSVIGSDGFGFAPEKDRYVKVPHLGSVRIDDDVEIGANNTVDRGTFGETWLQGGVKTDNLVHIAHNVTIGENTVIVAQVGIAGSVTIGRHGIIAGQAGIAGHLRLGDNVTVGGQAGIGKSIEDNEVVSGSPGMPHRLWLRVQRVIPMLPELKKALAGIEKRLSILEENEFKKRESEKE